MTFPRFILYESDGVTPVYEFDCVTNITDNQDPTFYVEHEALRGQGSIIVEVSNRAWDLPMTFVLKSTGITTAEKYEDLSAQIASLQSTIVKFTKYILKIQVTEGGSTKDYKVMRLNTMSFPIEDNANKRITIQRVELTLRVDCWA